MWLAFAADEATGYFFVGLVSGPKAYSMARWMRNETVEAESMTLNGIPVIMFSGHEANTSVGTQPVGYGYDHDSYRGGDTSRTNGCQSQVLRPKRP